MGAGRQGIFVLPTLRVVSLTPLAGQHKLKVVERCRRKCPLNCLRCDWWSCFAIHGRRTNCRKVLFETSWCGHHKQVCLGIPGIFEGVYPPLRKLYQRARPVLVPRR